MSQEKHAITFEDQINIDQKRYSRYVCDSRAIPNEIDGLKPVQRRILWTMWNSVAKKHYTKTVKVTGLVMGYHPHGDASISDALSAMAQDFTFANNYPLVSGEGTFGDVLDPKAVASPRYTEVRISPFAIDAGFFESIPDIDYKPNYDETTKEPIFFVPKVPVVLLNPISGIATGFRALIPGHKLTDVTNAMKTYLKTGKCEDITPWYKNYNGKSSYITSEDGSKTFITGFGLKKKDKSIFIVSAPQNWNREKVITYLDEILTDKDTPFRSYIDHSSSDYEIELVLKKGRSLTTSQAYKIFHKTTNERVIPNIITSEGKLEGHNTPVIIKNFCEYRKEHLKRRFTRLAAEEEEKISRNNELIRFINEKWNLKVTSIKNKKTFEKKLKESKFVHFEYLSGIPVYRMTTEEIKKCKDAVIEAKKQLQYYKNLIKSQTKLKNFIVDEITQLAEKYDGKSF